MGSQKSRNVPRHVALIPDGNRRFAKRLLKTPWKGHEWGIGKIKEVFEWCKELDIRIMTVYALSAENFDKRPKREIGYLLRLAKKEIRDAIKNRNHFIHKNKVRMIFFGRPDRLPQDLQEDIKTLMDTTKAYKDYVINMAVVYGGRQEIVDACRKIAAEVASGRLRPGEIGEKAIRRNLYTNGYPDPDLIIRTSEQRLSGFLLWQSAYSELAFIDTFWPDLTKKQFFDAVKNYSERERRLGK